jgi:antitoxin (DNA-binding transcriptional repressor) of toxin-antitoxin stability system
MKTLTITEAKKNLGRWLTAAARGQDVGIIAGADIIALRKVEVESTDYAQREYGVTPEQALALDQATDARYRRLARSRKLVTVTAEELRKMLALVPQPKSSVTYSEEPFRQPDRERVHERQGAQAER